MMLSISRFSIARRIRATEPAILIGVLAFVLVCIAAVVAPYFAPFDYAEQNLMERLEPPSANHWFGTDNFGRDIFSRVLWGARLSLLIGLGATVLGMLVGGTLGVWAGYRGGLVDTAIMRLVDVLLSFPSFILCLLIIAMTEPSIPILISAIAVSLVPKFARVARSSAATISTLEYIDACRTIGASHFRIMSRHVFPNISGELFVMASLWTAHAVLIEASLSFLGLGIRPPTPVLGGMMLEGMNVLHEAPWLTLMPGLTILVFVLMLNAIGDHLRDLVDPRLREA